MDSWSNSVALRHYCNTIDASATWCAADILTRGFCKNLSPLAYLPGCVFSESGGVRNWMTYWFVSMFKQTHRQQRGKAAWQTKCLWSALPGKVYTLFLKSTLSIPSVLIGQQGVHLASLKPLWRPCWQKSRSSHLYFPALPLFFFKYLTLDSFQRGKLALPKYLSES